ncbi:MAG: DUF2157 domain-containing protein [bacterium]
MNKEELLGGVKKLAKENLITEEELARAYDEGAGKPAGSEEGKRIRASEILYYIGGIIVLLGIVVLVSQNWAKLGSFGQIIATLGSSVAAFFVGVLFCRRQNFYSLGQVFYVISAILMPLGLFVVFNNAGFNIQEAGVQLLISSILFAVYLISFAVLRQSIFVAFSIIFGTGVFFTLTNFMFVAASLSGSASQEFFQYRILLTGLSYILIGYSFAKNKLYFLTGPLYSFGLVFFFSSVLMIGGTFWDLLFPGLVLGAIFLSIHLKSKAFLAFGSLFLMAYILKITSQYFANSLGWPFALILAGFALMAIGYLSFYLNKKYISSPNL